jgi:hypothetical protein
MLSLRGLISRVFVAVLATLVAVGLAELSLRLELKYLPLSLANALGSGYVDFGNGIYRFNPELNMERMRPHYSRQMFFDGYFWHHQTDWMGFRNPTDRQHYDIALIGDSMIYGHGLEETSTVGSKLEKLLGRPVANLGIQGGAMDDEYEIMRRDAIRVSPRLILIFFLNNDLTDLGRLSDDELRRFIDLPIDDHTSRYFRLRAKWHSRSSTFDCRDLYVVRGYLFLVHQLHLIFHRRRVPDSASTAPADLIAPNRAAVSESAPTWVRLAPFAGDPRMQLAMHFHLRAILKADDFARRHNIHFAYVFIAVPQPFDSTYETIIADYCRAHGIDFLSLRQTYESAQRSGLEIYLPHDGHLSEVGAKVTAEALASRFLSYLH